MNQMNLPGGGRARQGASRPRYDAAAVPRSLRVVLCVCMAGWLAGMIRPQGAGAQEIVTADRYLETVSERYRGIRDYQARIAIRSGTTDMYGTLIHREPNLLRIDFSSPANQVFLYNGEALTIFLPEYQAVLNQTVTANYNSGANLATAQGLSLLRRNYASAFITSQAPQALDGNSTEQVVKLRLTRRSPSEGFRELTLSISADTKLIRRIEGRTLTDAYIRLDFTAIRLNQGISESRFIFDPPSMSNQYNNFLFRESD